MRKSHRFQVASSRSLVSCFFTELSATVRKHYHPGSSLESVCWFHLSNEFVSF